MLMQKEKPSRNSSPPQFRDVKNQRRPRSRVRIHPLRDQIDSYLRDHYSPRTVLRLLETEYGERLEEMPPLPSVRSIERYRANHVLTHDLLPAHLIEQRLQDIGPKIDMFGSLQQAFRLAEDRLARLYEAEEAFPFGLPAFDKACAALVRLGELLWRVGQDLGIYPRASLAFPYPGTAEPRVSNQGVVDSASEFDDMTDEDWEHLFPEVQRARALRTC